MDRKNASRRTYAIWSVCAGVCLMGLLALFQVFAGGVPTFAAGAILPNVYPASHCLYGSVNAVGTGSNELDVTLHEGSGCGLRNAQGSMYYKIHSTCNGIGQQDRYGTIPFQSLNPNQRVQAPGSAPSYCIQCSRGRIVGFPPFQITLSITSIDAYALVNGKVRTDIPLAMSYDSPQTTATGTAGNYLGFTGGLTCPPA